MKGVDEGVICNIHSRRMVRVLRLGVVLGFIEGSKRWVYSVRYTGSH